MRFLEEKKNYLYFFFTVLSTLKIMKKERDFYGMKMVEEMEQERASERA